MENPGTLIAVLLALGWAVRTMREDTRTPRREVVTQLAIVFGYLGLTVGVLIVLLGMSESVPALRERWGVLVIGWLAATLAGLVPLIMLLSRRRRDLEKRS